MRKPAILYVSYDGMLEPLGQSQVLAYLERLSAQYEIHLLSFEKKADTENSDKLAALRTRIAAAGISWTWRRYHKAPTAPATAFDIAAGTAAALGIALRHRIRIVHCRSYIAMLIGLAVKRVTGARLLFDMRGLWADERVDAGLWSREGRLYRMTKRLERRFLLAADHIVTLTRASAAEIGRFPYMAGAHAPITVIPTCADLERFRPAPHGKGDGGFVYGFVGAVGTWSLFSEVLRSFGMILERRPEARLLVVNRGEHDLVRRDVAASGIAPERVELVAAEHREMPALVARMSAAAALRRPSYSQVACAPTKLAEYLGCGVPCLVNTGIGDVAEIVEADGVGSVAADFSDAALRPAVDRLLALADDPQTRERCVAAAQRRFSVADGVDAYRRIYGALLTAAGAAA
jgi:glycosyltransferase involved in cell wall biosynthesis